MGLDMYLYQRTPKAGEEEGVYEQRKVAYWRKANQIHAWFVREVQNGVDDCGEYPVSRTQLQTLLTTTQQVLDATRLTDGVVLNGYRYQNGQRIPITEAGQVVADASVAKRLLPTQDGFFFGGTNYDQWYVRDLTDTVEQLTRVLADPLAEDFTYHSSW